MGVQRTMEDHVAAGNLGAWYPEGKLNTGNPCQLQTFRAGGFTLPAKIDCEIWCIAHVGNATCWHPKASVGGQPCHIKVKYFRLCESSFALADSMPKIASSDDPVRARSLYIAKCAQEAMQSVIDALLLDKWASVQKENESSVTPLLAGNAGA